MVDAGGQSKVVLVRDLRTKLVLIEQNTQRMESNHSLDILGREDSVVQQIDPDRRCGGEPETHKNQCEYVDQ
jgi:hypothetical protein